MKAFPLRKKNIALLGLATLLVACQAPRLASQVNVDRRGGVQSFNQNAQTLDISSFKRIQLNKRFQQELNTLPEPSTQEVQPTEAELTEMLHAGDIHTSYVAEAHPQFFTELDKGLSSVEQILLHDGQRAAATYVQHWRRQLGENASWPDAKSTTYGGPFRALEHGMPTPTKGWFGLKNGRDKADEYYQRAIAAWKPELAPTHPEQAEAWAWLGRSSHFIQDLTVPFHTRPLARLAQIRFHSKYEQAAQLHFRRYLPTANYDDYDVWEQDPYPANQQWGVYFPQNMPVRDMMLEMRELSAPFYKMVAEGDDPNTHNWEKVRSVMIPLGAKATSGLMVKFLNDVKVNPQ